MDTVTKKALRRTEIMVVEDQNMAYYSSPRQYQNVTGKKMTTNCPSIHKTGSVRGMNKQELWKRRDKVRYGDWIYLQP